MSEENIHYISHADSDQFDFEVRAPSPRVHYRHSENERRRIHGEAHRHDPGLVRETPFFISVEPEHATHQSRRAARQFQRHHQHDARFVEAPPDHDIVADYFRRGRGMEDHDELLIETRREAHQAALRREAEFRQELASVRHRRESLERLVFTARRGRRRAADVRIHGSTGSGSTSEIEIEVAGPSEDRRWTMHRTASDSSLPRVSEEEVLEWESEASRHRWDELQLGIMRLEHVQQQAVLTAQYSRTHDDELSGSAIRFPRPSIIQGNAAVGPRTPPSRSPHDKPVLCARVGFMFLSQGKAIHSKDNEIREHLIRKGTTSELDIEIIKEMQAFYASRVASLRRLPWLKRLALAKFVRVSGDYPDAHYCNAATHTEVLVQMEHHYNPSRALRDGHREKVKTWKWRCTAQCWLLNSKDDSSFDRFEFLLDHPLKGENAWMQKLGALASAVPDRTEYIIWLYLFERVNYRFALGCIAVYVALGTAGGVVYGVLRDDVGTGLTMSSYIVGLFAVLTGIWTAGEHLGVESPDKYTYSFDTVYGADETENSALTVSDRPNSK